MTIRKILLFSITFTVLLFIYSFGFKEGKNSVTCPDCGYFMTRVHDSIYLSEQYERLYNSCVEGKILPNTEDMKKDIDEMKSKYKFNTGVLK